MKLQCFEIAFGTPYYDWTIDLRNQILRIPLKLEFSIDDLSKEYDSMHFVCIGGNMDLLACCVMVPLDENLVKMRQVATFEEYQNKGIGSHLMQFVENEMQKKGFEKIELNARDVAIPFYEKLNYKIVGKPFTEVGIPHRKMEKSISSKK